MRWNLTHWLLVALVMLAGGRAAQAQPLADRVRADAWVYLGWAGTQKLGDGYEKSHCKGVMDTLDLRNKTRLTLDALTRAELLTAAQQAQWDETLGLFWFELWQYPLALAILPEPDLNGSSQVSGMVLVEAPGAEEAKALAQRLNQSLAKPLGDPEEGSTQLPQFVVEGNTLAVALDAGSKPAWVGSRAYPAPGASLRENPRFTEGMSRTVSAPAAAFYLNLPGIIQAIEKDVTRNGSKAKIDEWKKMAEALGLAQIGALSWAGEFHGADWRASWFLALPGQRVGLAEVLTQGRLDPALLQAIPAEATSMVACHFSIPRFYDAIRQSSAAGGEKQARLFTDGPLDFTRETGVDLEKELIRPLGEDWAAYSRPLPATVFQGPLTYGPMRLTVLHRPADPKVLEEGLMGMEDYLMEDLSRNHRGPQMFQFTEATREGQTIHTIQTPVGRWDWRIQQGILEIAPATTMNAAVLPAHSLMQTPAFQEFLARQQLGLGESGDKRVLRVSYADLRQTGPEMLRDLQSLNNLLGMMLMQKEQVQLPMNMLPTWNMLEPHLGLDLGVVFVDGEGLHGRNEQPFPEAHLLAPTGVLRFSMPANLGTLVGAGLPAMYQARAKARQIQSMSNIKHFCLGTAMYMADHKDQFPARLEDLFPDYVTDVKLLLSSRQNLLVPAEYDGWSADQQRAWAIAHSAFVLVPPREQVTQIKNVAYTVTIFEKPLSTAAEERVAVGFLDGHVERMPPARLEKLLREQTGKGLAQWVTK